MLIANETGFQDPVSYELPDKDQGRGLFAIEPGDFNNDGKLDIAAGYFDCRLAFYEGDGTGKFTYVRNTFFTSRVQGDDGGRF